MSILAEKWRCCTELHDRTKIRVPLGHNRITRLNGACAGELGAAITSIICELAVLPLVMRVPPLASLLWYGCGCEKCKKYEDPTQRQWVTSFQLINFYMLVVATDVMFDDRRRRAALMKMPSVEAAASLMRFAFSAFIRGIDPESAAELKALHNLFVTDADDASRAMALAKVSRQFALRGGALYTWRVIAQLEMFVWMKIMEEFSGTVQGMETFMFCGAPTDVLSYGVQASEEARKECDVGIVTQHAGVRMRLCNDPVGTQINPFAAVHIPSIEQLAKACKEVQQTIDVAELVTPVEGAANAMLAVYYALLLSNFKNVVKTSAAAALAARQEPDDEHVVADADAITSASGSD